MPARTWRGRNTCPCVDGAAVTTERLTPARVRVAGARHLTLAVLFGRHGDVQDHVDWGDARLIK